MMFFKKIQYRVEQGLRPIIRQILGIQLDWGYIFFSGICIVAIVLLGTNIYRTIRKGYERYEIILSEKERLEKLIEKNLALKEDLKYYSSKEYIDLKAREELNLAFPNQRLVYIEKPVSIPSGDEPREEVKKPNPSWKLWYDLLFS